MATFAELLRARIESTPDLTEAGLAVKAGLDNATIRKIIAGNRNPRIDTIRKICAALGTTPKNLWVSPAAMKSEIFFA